jgi:cell division protein FtsI (penicillin-binding protein 3)
MLGLFGILARLVELQVADASTYREMAREQRLRSIVLPASRGSILDRDGYELAMSLPAKAVFADPALVRDPLDVARAVAAILDLDEGEVYDAVTKAGDRFVYIERGVDLVTAGRLEELELPGIGFLEESRRHYPAGALASQVLGFVGTDGGGLEGLELQHDRLLSGRPGHAVVEEDPSGTLIPQAAIEDVPPVPGNDVVLTIDKDLQYRAQASLASAVRANKAKGGTLIVMDPHTGDILALAVYPWFDPNEFGEAEERLWRNTALIDAYEPGSVNKVIAASAAVEEGLVPLNETFSVPEQIQIYDRVYHDDHSHGVLQMTLADIVTHSSNVGAIMVAEAVGAGHFAEYLQRFGFGARTGVGFPGESPGILDPVGSWTGTTLPSIAIGQAIGVTSVQMAAVYATIANGGVWVRPRLVRGTVEEGGAFVAAPPSDTRRVVSGRTAQAVTRMLSFAVQVGTGEAAEIPGFWVAGKTGTARKPLPNRLGYSEERHIASFIGFTPASRPALVVAAVLDEPETVYGGIAAAPLFQDVARSALALLRVPPAAKPPTPPHAVPTG